MAKKQDSFYKADEPTAGESEHPSEHHVLHHAKIDGGQPLDAPTPIMALVLVWVVETGMPNRWKAAGTAPREENA